MRGLNVGREVMRACVIACLTTVGAAFAQSPDAAPSLDTFEATQSRVRDAETLAALSAEGQLLFRRARVKLDGYRYCSQAVVQAERGELRESVRSASMALHLGQTQGNDDLVAVSKRDLAIAYSYAGDLDSAEQYAREALSHEARDPRLVAGPAYKTLADVAMRRGKLEEAIDLYEQAAIAASDRFRPLIEISLANAYVATGDAARARTLYDRIILPETSLQPLYQRGLGNLLLVEGRPSEALQAFEAAARDAAGTDAIYHRVWAMEGAARSHLALGDRRAARENFNDAVRLSESIRARFRSEEFKTGLFGDMQMIFEQAILLATEEGADEEAWMLSERSRARALLDIVRERVVPSGDVNLLASAADIGEVTRALQQGETMVQFHALADQLVVWTISTQGLRSQILPIPRDELDGAVDALLDSIFARRRDSVPLAAALHDRLLAPLALPSGERLIIVPHSGLHYLPFQALHTSDGFLIERHPIAVVPSASVAVQLLGRGQLDQGLLVGFGNPATNEREQLPGAEEEVKRIGQLFPDNRLFFQREATKDQFREMAGIGSILHVAAHAEVDRVDPLHSRILLAADNGDPGFLEAREIYTVDLNNVSLVTLSACETGLGRVARGDEIQGFTRSFLSAGVSSLVVSLWPVADDSTELLMTTFYQELAQGSNVIDAMQRGQLAVLSQPAFAHPFFWAPFNLIGDWRMSASR